MKQSLTGSWQSVRSNIPDYRPGNEWLHFTSEGDHVWEVGQPEGKGKASRNRVDVSEEGDGYRMFLVKDGSEGGSKARINWVGDDEIQVTPVHGFVTAFKRAKKSNSGTDKPASPSVSASYN